MRNLILFFILCSSCFAQDLLIGKKAPNFSAQALVNSEIVENFSLEAFYGKYVVLFFYPLDFTFICPTGSWCKKSELDVE